MLSGSRSALVSIAVLVVAHGGIQTDSATAPEVWAQTSLLPFSVSGRHLNITYSAPTNLVVLRVACPRSAQSFCLQGCTVQDARRVQCAAAAKIAVHRGSLGPKADCTAARPGPDLEHL